MPPLYALKSLCLDDNIEDDCTTFLTLSKSWLNLTELSVSHYCDLLDMDVLAQQLINHRRVYFSRISLNDFMQFVRYSVHLTKVKVNNLTDGNVNLINILDIAAFRAELYEW